MQCVCLCCDGAEVSGWSGQQIKSSDACGVWRLWAGSVWDWSSLCGEYVGIFVILCDRTL